VIDALRSYQRLFVSPLFLLMLASVSGEMSGHKHRITQNERVIQLLPNGECVLHMCILQRGFSIYPKRAHVNQPRRNESLQPMYT
jgi:hypothetical protein